MAGSTAFDGGTITFRSKRPSGTYDKVDFYKYKYEGKYQVDGDKVTLTEAKKWTGKFVGSNRLEGTWKNEGKVENWKAVRQMKP